MSQDKFSIETMHDGYVKVDFDPDLDLMFGVFLEVGYRGPDGHDWTLTEIPRKKARKLAKAILKMTRKGKR